MNLFKTQNNEHSKHEIKRVLLISYDNKSESIGKLSQMLFIVFIILKIKILLWFSNSILIILFLPPICNFSQLWASNDDLHFSAKKKRRQSQGKRWVSNLLALPLFEHSSPPISFEAAIWPAAA